MGEASSPAQQERRYGLAVICFFGITIAAVALGTLLVVTLLSGLLWLIGGNELLSTFWQGHPPFTQYILQQMDKLLLPLLLVGMILGFLYGYHLWERLFLKSGYLSAETVQRLVEKNMAPTERMERARKAIGFILLIPLFSWMTWLFMTMESKGESEWWRLVVLVPLGILAYLLYHVWREYFSRKNR